MCIHHRKVMRHRKPNERRITCAFANAGWLRAAASERPAVPSQPCQLLRLAEATIPAQPLAPWPLSPEAADSRHKRNRPQQMGPLTLAGPSKHCVLVTCHLLLFSGLTTLQDSAFGFVWDTKGRRKKKGEEKLTRCLFTQAQIFWKSRHHEKNQIMCQQKQSNPPPTRSGLAPLRLPSPHFPLEYTQGPSEVIRRRDFTSRNLCKESARTKGHLQFYKMADVMLLLKNEDLPYWVGEEKTRQEGKNREKSCWPGLRQIDSSIDFPFTVTVHPSLLWLHWPISEKKAIYYRLNQNVQKENTPFVEQTNRVRRNITYSTQREKKIVSI